LPAPQEKGLVMDAGKPTILCDLSSLAYEVKHERARRALALQTDELQVSVYELEPGGLIPAHRHSVSWDVSLVLEGEIEARFKDGEKIHSVRLGPHMMNLVPPGAVHEIFNPSSDKVAKFLLVQSPSRGFDFRREGA
jgi:quercetin dioxygenase-like cupin family protein